MEVRKCFSYMLTEARKKTKKHSLIGEKAWLNSLTIGRVKNSKTYDLRTTQTKLQLEVDSYLTLRLHWDL